MKITSYIASLLPSFGKERVLEDIGITKRELQTQAIPEYTSTVKDLPGWKYKSNEVKKLQEIFARNCQKGNMIEVIARALPVVLTNLEEVEKLINATYQKDVASAGITYQSTTLLQLAEFSSFISKYSRKLLVYVITAETAAMPDSGTVLSEALTPAGVRWVNENILSFCSALLSMTEPPASLTKLVEAIPEIIVTPENETGLSETMGTDKIDPLKTRFVPLWMNPIYHVRMVWADYQTNRYKQAQEEVNLLQLARLNLIYLNEKKPDAKLQERIQLTESRIHDLEAKLRDMEKSHG